jgi:hypothetical protein
MGATMAKKVKKKWWPDPDLNGGPADVLNGFN